VLEGLDLYQPLDQTALGRDMILGEAGRRALADVAGRVAGWLLEDARVTRAGYEPR
jgi:hypothetical protein